MNTTEDLIQLVRDHDVSTLQGILNVINEYEGLEVCGIQLKRIIEHLKVNYDFGVNKK